MSITDRAAKATIMALAIAGVTACAPPPASIEDIKHRGILRIGADMAGPPYMTRTNGEIVGFEPDLLAEVAKKLGVKLQIDDVAFSGLLPAMQVGKFDAVCSGMVITKDRLKRVAFTAPYSSNPPNLLVPSNLDIKDVSGMSGKRLGFAFSSSLTKYVESYNAKLASRGRKPMALSTYETTLDAINDLKNRRIDAVASKLSTLKAYVKERPADKFKIIDNVRDMVDAEYLTACALPKSNASLLGFMNEAIAEMSASGELAKLQVKWFGEALDVPKAIPDNIP